MVFNCLGIAQIFQPFGHASCRPAKVGKAPDFVKKGQGNSLHGEKELLECSLEGRAWFEIRSSWIINAKLKPYGWDQIS